MGFLEKNFVKWDTIKSWDSNLKFSKMKDLNLYTERAHWTLAGKDVQWSTQKYILVKSVDIKDKGKMLGLSSQNFK